MNQFLSFLFLFVVVFISTIIHAESFSGICPNGAQVQQESYCAFFKHYNTDAQAQLDTRIKDFLGVKSAKDTRSIGLIISIAKYPLIPGHDISAAAVDGERLTDFLINDQKFDEVIFLQDDEASTEAITYFLQSYLVNRANEFKSNEQPGLEPPQPKARLLIAYSGHGTSSGKDGTQASFLLSTAKSPTDPVHSYKMKNFSSDVQNLAGQYFHVLTLINACFGGDFFPKTSAPGGDAAAPEFPGSYGITAGSSKDETVSLDIKRGSLFFDLLIEGVRKGIADSYGNDSYLYDYASVDEKGNISEHNGLTRAEPLHTYLSTAYSSINKSLMRKNKKFQKLSKPWFGPTDDQIAEGAFFFFSKKGIETIAAVLEPYNHSTMLASNDSFSTTSSFGIKDTHNTDKLELTKIIADMPESSKTNAVGGDVYVDSVVGVNPNPISAKPIKPAIESTSITMLPSGPISSIRGKPEIKIFKPPQVYPIHGFDFSSAEGNINWKNMNDTSRPRFIYARAVGWNGPDKTFGSRWSQSKSLGIDHGAYMKFDFCRSPEDQLRLFSKLVPSEPDALPLAIEIVNPKGENKRQLECLNSIGFEVSKKAILKLASDIRTHYGKTPLLYGNRNNLSTFLDQRSDEFMIWLGSYGASGIKLSGHNPWTLWQYSGTLNIDGVGSKTTGEVFFGTEEQYQLFKKGKSNVALDAVI